MLVSNITLYPAEPPLYTSCGTVAIDTVHSACHMVTVVGTQTLLMDGTCHFDSSKALTNYHLQYSCTDDTYITGWSYRK